MWANGPGSEYGGCVATLMTPFWPVKSDDEMLKVGTG